MVLEYGHKEIFKPFISKIRINGVERDCLRDSGSNVDIVAQNWIDFEYLLGETIWLCSPLDNVCKNLPLAKVVLSGDFGEVITKVAVKPEGLDEGIYLLGNRTALLIEEARKRVEPINAVETRCRARENKRKADEQIEIETKVEPVPQLDEGEALNFSP